MNVLIVTSDCAYGDGTFHKSDIKYLHTEDYLNIEEHYMKNFPFATNNSTELFTEKASKYDLVIFPFHSSAMQQYISLHAGSFKKLKDSKIVKIAVWSLDNHLFKYSDSIVREQVDFFYYAHPSYSDHLKFKNCRFLPVSYYLSGIDGLLDDVSSVFRKTIDISCIFRYFPHHNHSADRSTRAYLLLKKLLQKFPQKKIFMGSVKFGDDYIKAIKSSKIVLNLSMLDDFNIRNLEVLALDSVLVANKTSHTLDTMAKYEINDSTSYFFNNNLSDFESKMSLALEQRTVKPTHQSILNGNMLINRYIEIINDIFGTVYTVNSIDSPKTIHLTDPVKFTVEQSYSIENLGIKTALCFLENSKFDSAKKILKELL